MNKCIKILKFYVKNESGMPVENLHFKLQAKCNKDRIYNAISDCDGLVYFYDICFGNYILEEIEVPYLVMAQDIKHPICIANNCVKFKNEYVSEPFELIYEESINDFFFEFEAEVHPDNGLDYKALIIGLAGAAFSKIPYAGSFATAIFNSLCGVGTQNFGELYKQIREIIKDELTSKEIDDMNGELNGVIQDIKEFYNPAKLLAISNGTISNESTRQSLRVLIQPKLATLNSLVGKLQMSRYQKLGFPTYLLVSLQKIIVAQELASIDVNLDPNLSSYASSVKVIATDALSYASEVAWLIAIDRRVKIYAKCHSPIFSKDYYLVRDDYIKKDIGGKYTGADFCCDVIPKPAACNNARDKCNIDVENIRNQITGELYEQWGYTSWVNTMNGLLTQPLRPVK